MITKHTSDEGDSAWKLTPAEDRRGDEASLLRRAAAEVQPDNPDSNTWHARYVAGHLNRFTQDLRMVRGHVRAGSRVLEVGASPPLLTAALAWSGYSVTGIDIDPSRYAKTITSLGLDVRTCDIEREAPPFDDSTFDCVLFNEVFEHLRIDPPATLAELRRVLAPKGLLMMSTPNLHSYRGLVNLVRHQRAWVVGAEPFEEYGKLSTLGHMGHVREYTAGEVVRCLKRCGFSIEKIVPRGSVESRPERLATWMRPALLPFVSVLARKQDPH